MKWCDLHPFYPHKYCWDCIHRQQGGNIREMWDAVKGTLCEKRGREKVPKDEGKGEKNP